MKIDESNRCGSVTKGQIQVLEEFLGARLPTDYKDFLLEHNGGVPVPNTIPPLDESKSDYLVREFFGVHRGPFQRNLIRNIKMLHGRIPDGMIPIADDPFGNTFCLALKRDRGQVFFWDHELEENGHGDGSHDAALTHLANSFTEFTEMLEEQTR